MASLNIGGTSGVPGCQKVSRCRLLKGIPREHRLELLFLSIHFACKPIPMECLFLFGLRQLCRVWFFGSATLLVVVLRFTELSHPPILANAWFFGGGKALERPVNLKTTTKRGRPKKSKHLPGWGGGIWGGSPASRQVRGEQQFLQTRAHERGPWGRNVRRVVHPRVRSGLDSCGRKQMEIVCAPPRGRTKDAMLFLCSFSPTAESFGVSAHISSGVVQGGPEVRFHEGSTRVLPGFHQGFMRVSIGSARAAGRCEHQKGRRMLLGTSPELIFFSAGSSQILCWSEWNRPQNVAFMMASS